MCAFCRFLLHKDIGPMLMGRPVQAFNCVAQTSSEDLNFSAAGTWNLAKVIVITGFFSQLELFSFSITWPTEHLFCFVSKNRRYGHRTSSRGFGGRLGSVFILIVAIPMCCNNVAICYSQWHNTCINQQIKIFSNQWLCILWGAQSLTVPGLCSVFGLMMARCSWNMLPRF
jgi:hypothetical protein